MKFRINEEQAAKVELLFREELKNSIPNLLGVISINPDNFIKHKKPLNKWNKTNYKGFGIGMRVNLNDVEFDEDIDYNLDIPQDFFKIKIVSEGESFEQLESEPQNSFGESTNLVGFRDFNREKYYYLVERKPFYFGISGYEIKGNKYNFETNSGIIERVIPDSSYVKLSIFGRYALVEENDLV